MIGRLSGTLAEKNPPQILVDVGGVGYEVDVPMSTFYNLPASGESDAADAPRGARGRSFPLRFRQRGGTLRLPPAAQDFRVGARTALSVLSGLSVADLAQAVAMQEPAA